MRVYDFECTSCGSTHEHFVQDSNVTVVACKDCGCCADRKLCSPRFTLDPNDKAGFPTAYANWDKHHKNKQANKPESE